MLVDLQAAQPLTIDLNKLITNILSYDQGAGPSLARPFYYCLGRDSGHPGHAFCYVHVVRTFSICIFSMCFLMWWGVATSNVARVWGIPFPHLFGSILGDPCSLLYYTLCAISDLSAKASTMLPETAFSVV